MFDLTNGTDALIASLVALGVSYTLTVIIIKILRSIYDRR